MRALVIEDEKPLQSQLKQLLGRKLWSVDVSGDGEEGLYLAREYGYDLAIVDLGLPKLNGIEVIKRLRAEGHRLPVLILTARDHWQQKVEGLEAGADDYLTKPFHPEELMARVNALARRSAGQASPLLHAGPLTLDLSSQQLSRDGEPVTLTGFEYKLLEYLMLNAGQVLSKTVLTEHLYEQDFDRDSNVIEVLMARLRKKIDPDGSWQPLVTVRGRGYQFAAAVEHP